MIEKRKESSSSSDSKPNNSKSLDSISGMILDDPDKRLIYARLTNDFTGNVTSDDVDSENSIKIAGDTEGSTQMNEAMSQEFSPLNKRTKSRNRKSVSVIDFLRHDVSLKTIHSLSIVDFFISYDEVPNKVTKRDLDASHSHGVISPRNTRYWSLIILIALWTAVVSLCLNWIIQNGVFRVRDMLSEGGSLSMYLLSAITFSIVSVGSCSILSKEAIGSGIPGVKTMLSGSHIPNFASFYTLIAKVVGLICATGTGLSVGKEGPFVHIAVCIASLLSNLKPFKTLVSTKTGRLSLYSIAIAAGVTATFGAPLGGVIFSIEVTSTFVMVHSLWKAYACSALCILIFRYFSQFALIELCDVTALPRWTFNSEIIAFALLGVCCGCMGGLFIYTTSKIAQIVNRSLTGSSIKFIYTAMVALLLSTISFYVLFIGRHDKTDLENFFSEDELDTDIWGETSTHTLKLALYSIYKLFVTALSVTCPIPCGVFSPIFTVGAGMGRFIGTCLRDLGFDSTIPAGFAVAGAAAMAGAVTRTISVTVIVYELTGQLYYMVPILVSVLMAYLMSSCMTIGFYDVMINLNHLSYLPALRALRHYDLIAEDCQCSVEPFSLCPTPTLLDLVACSLVSPYSIIPVVEEDMRFMGVIKVTDALEYVSQCVGFFESIENIKNEINRTSVTPVDEFDLYDVISSLNKGHVSEEIVKELRQWVSSRNVSPGLEFRPTSKIDKYPLSMSSGLENPVTVGGDGLIDTGTCDRRRMRYSNQTVCDVADLKAVYADMTLLPVDTAPLTILPTWPMSRIQFLLTMLSLSEICVVDKRYTITGIVGSEMLHAYRPSLDNLASMRRKGTSLRDSSFNSF